jgi:hypothetical protein
VVQSTIYNVTELNQGFSGNVLPPPSGMNLCLLPVSCCLLAWLTLWPWWWRKYVPLKQCRTSTGLHGITSPYLNSTETVETAEPLSTDETTSLFDSTAVFASVLRGTFWLLFVAVCVAIPRFWKWTLSIQWSCTSYQFTCSTTLLTFSEWAAAILTTWCGRHSALVVGIPNAGILAWSQQVVNIISATLLEKPSTSHRVNPHYV